MPEWGGELSGATAEGRWPLAAPPRPLLLRSLPPCGATRRTLRGVPTVDALKDLPRECAQVTIAGGVGQHQVRKLAYDLCRAVPLLDADYGLLLDGIKVR
jgi:hypothetical protein